MQIAIVGMGHVGLALGRRWSSAGHNVQFCVRHPTEPQKITAAKEMHATISHMSSAEEFPVILLAVPWREVTGLLKEMGVLEGKVLLDCTNPVDSEFTHLTIGHDTSAGETVAALKPRAKVVKVFNTNGATNMANPDYGNSKVTMFLAGDYRDANHIAASLASDAGFEPLEIGPLQYARLLEPLAMTWIVLSRQRGLGRDFAINFVRRPE